MENSELMEALIEMYGVGGADAADIIEEGGTPGTSSPTESVGEVGMLTYIPLEELHPHPDNPRKELGDLTELAESIKAKGVMQNLTVVPRAEGGYTVIIGHRRSEAARIAGLDKVPCVIVEMSEREQVATMLLENMQRVDLTAFEQAQGFQMMMDLGDSVEGIAEKTGLSKRTVRGRLKMAELDADTFRKVSAGRQILISDLEKLSEIEDMDKRNKVLADIGTANFNNSLKSALSEQKAARALKEMREAFTAAGFEEVKSQDYSKYNYVFALTGTENLEADIARAKENGVSVYFHSYGCCFYMMRKKDNVAGKKTEAQLKREQEERERKERYDALKALFERAYELRREFISNYSLKQAAINLGKIASFLVVNGMNGDLYDGLEGSEFETLLFGREREISSFEEMCDFIDSSDAAKAMLVAVWLISDDKSEDCFDYYGSFEENPRLNMAYEFLESIGYEMSDEERELIDGTHEVFKRGAV